MAGPYQKSNLPQGNIQEQVFQSIHQGVCQAVDFDGTSEQATAFQNQTTLIRVFATEDCFIQIGLASGVGPTAAANTSMFIPGGIIDFVGVPPGGGYQLAVIQSSQSGILYITEAG